MRILLLNGLVCLVFVCSATVSAQEFIHPGIMNSRAELDFIKKRVNENAEPWVSGYNKMMTYLAKAPESANPCVDYTWDCRNRLRDESAGAYAMALNWYIRGDKSHADKAVAIFNTWATTLKTYAPRQCLSGTWGFPRMVNAAEILRDYEGWTAEDKQKFKEWLSNIIYSALAGCESDRSNWDASGTAIGLQIAVFVDDREKFNASLNRLKQFLPVYVKPSGCNNESDRDQAHAQMGIGFLADACEVAWQQGIDVYSLNDNLLYKGFEYTAQYNLGQEVDDTGCQPGKKISTKARGGFHPLWEVAFNHYHNRRKMEMPFSAEAVKKVRPEGLNEHQIPWATLTHADLGLLDQKVDTPKKISFEKRLQTGWNLISLPLQPLNTDIVSLLGENRSIDVVFAFDSTKQTYQSYIPGVESNDLKTMEAGRGYWIYVNSASQLKIEGIEWSHAIVLKEGWNLAGFNSISDKEVTDVARAPIVSVYSFDSASNSYTDNLATGTEFAPGHGYWIYTEKNMALIIPK
jgi:hypothetical protein